MNHDSFRRQRASDAILGHIDRALNNIAVPQVSQRSYPAEGKDEGEAATPSLREQRASAAMMRVNHAGEMAAQALYHGQSLIARDPHIKHRLHHASMEESDHLNWCRRRLESLNARPSRLDPLWYAGSFTIGIAAGIAGDHWNLGFLAETERQVVRHLDEHLQALPTTDEASRAIVTQMREDELGHAELAESLGAATLPDAVKSMMRVTAKVMTTLAARL
jgi:ubiquinone biosynthesis monooxygenase Coq7